MPILAFFDAAVKAEKPDPPMRLLGSVALIGN
jgi:hypothetical protein